MCYAEKVWAEEARAEGMKLGIEKGIERGIKKGRIEGMEKGRLEGMEKGRLEGIRNLISAFRKINVGQVQILRELKRLYGLTPEEASSYLNT